jgi:O-succinylbenzoic acid--CoA ligase
MRINVRGTWWQSDALSSIDLRSLSDSEAAAIRLLADWDNGKLEFTFRTSGSTGPPKSVTFGRSQVAASAQLSIDALGVKKGMTALACLDTNFVAGAMMVIRSVVARMDLIVREPVRNPLKELDEAVDFLAVVPMQLAALMDESLAQLNNVSVIIVGGSPIPDAIVPRLQTLRPACFATYGMTETLTHVALQRLNGPERERSFHLLTGISASLDDRGCLVIEAPHLGPGPLHTNDLAEWTDDGGFRILGRSDDVINSGGVKIQSGRVEYAVGLALQQMGMACRYFVTSVPDELLKESAALVLEGSPMPGKVENDLKRLLASMLNKFEVPRHLLYTPRFMETATQKVDRKATMALIPGKSP